MKRIVALLFIVCAFCTINVMASSQVITGGKIENPDTLVIENYGEYIPPYNTYNSSIKIN